LATRKRVANDLAILKSKVEALTEVVAALEHLALRLFFVAEVLKGAFHNSLR
jgi:hypothetical protein